MKPAPSVPPPRFCRSDFLEARKTLGREPGFPVGVVLSPAGFAEMQAYGAKFPCKVAVDPRQPRETVAWYYLEENFHPFTSLIRA